MTFTPLEALLVWVGGVCVVLEMMRRHGTRTTARARRGKPEGPSAAPRGPSGTASSNAEKWARIATGGSVKWK